MQQFLDAFLEPANIVGHIAYVFLIISMMMRTMHWLRFFAIAAGSISAIYYYTLGDYVSVFWESLFSLVNIIQLTLLAIENRRGRFSEEEQLFFQSVLRNVERGPARRLIRAGKWQDIDTGEILVVEGTWPKRLKFIVSGHANITVDGREIAFVGPGDFLGEMSYLTGKAASATATAVTPVRFLSFELARLETHLDKNADLRHALEAGFNRNLVEKLVKANKEK
ncbi:MAG: popeye domain-containing protein [Rhizobiaceae bacterium]|nr:popeye domain-containing protein [Rhizobiaceae bacterium]